MLDKSCLECNRLLREYASVAAQRRNLKVQMNALQDSGLRGIAKRAAELAEQHQEVVRIKLEEHETLHHRSRAEAATQI